MKIDVLPGELALIAGDIHIGTDKNGWAFDIRAIEGFLRVVEAEQPEHIILIGDVGEFKNYMRHLKKPDKHCDGQDELDWVYMFLVHLKFIAPNSDIYYMEGNHEDMFTRYLYENAPNLASLRGLNVPSQLELDELDITWVDHHQHLKLGNFTLIHGQFLAGNKSGNAGHKGIIHYGNSYGQGHTHTLAKVYMTKEDGMHVAIETGHLRTQNADYLQKVKQWQQGFASVRFYEHDFYHPDVHPIIKFEGNYYTMFGENLFIT